MTEFNNNQNQDGSRDYDRMNNPNQNNKEPEYSFWAEQVPGNSYNYQNQGPNYWQYGNPTPNINQTMNAPKQKKEKKGGGKVVKFLTKAVCFGLIAGISFIGLQKIVDAIYPGSTPIGIIASEDNKKYEISYTDSASVKTADQSAVSKVASSTMPSIVSINCTATQTAQDWFGQQYSQDVESSGSGIIVGKTEEELLIATNNHVIEGANETYVTFIDGTKAEAVIKGTDTTADLAVVSVDITQLSEDTLNAISVAKLGDSDSVKVGEIAVAIGNALGYGQSLTVGYISAKDREVEVSDGNKMTFLQTDAAINPGNSGGALINIEGEVIGINTVKYASDEVEGMGYAIPISSASPIITELMNRETLSEEEQGYLGISCVDVTEEASAYYNIPVGVYIKDATKGAAADKAGLKAEDIITKVNDIEITSAEQLTEYVHSLKVGTVVTVTYMRNTDGQYNEAKVDVTLGQNPELSKNAE
jgi:serine protease Do